MNNLCFFLKVAARRMAAADKGGQQPPISNTLYLCSEAAKLEIALEVVLKEEGHSMSAIKASFLRSLLEELKMVLNELEKLGIVAYVSEIGLEPSRKIVARAWRREQEARQN